MQKIVIVCLVALVSLASCLQKKYGPFTVKGHLAHVTSVPQTVYLEKVSLNSANNITLDSQQLKPTGDYTLKGTGKEEDLYLVTIEHNPVAIVINDNSVIQMNIDLENSRRPIIIGSDATSALYGFITTYARRDSILRSLSTEMDSITTTKGGFDTATAMQLRSKGMVQLKDINDEIKKIVRTSPSPALVCYALERARDTDPQDVDSLVKTASLRFKQHSTIAIIKSLLVQAAQPAARQQGQDAPVTAYALLNQQAPDLTMTGTDGKTLSIKSFRGKYLLVDFWASWCGPCRMENPNVVAAYNKFKDKNFTILGVSLDSDKDAWAQAIKNDGLAWNHMSDLKQWESAAVSTYQFDGIPFNVLIDPTGKIIASELRGPALQAKLAEVLK